MANKMSNLNLGKTPVGQLLFKLSIPSMAGLLANALYMIINGIYLGKFVGPEALGGVTVAYPMQMILFAFTLLFGTGGGTLLSIAYGAKDNSKVKKIIASTLLFGVATYITICILTFIFIDPILTAFGGTGATLEHGKTYLLLLLPFFTFQGVSLIYENFLRSSGNSIMPMVAMISGAIMNILLGYIFIPVLELGTIGAGLATGLAETFGFIVLFIYVRAKTHHLRATFNKFTLSFKVFKEVVASGFAAFANQLAFSIRALVLNILALSLGGESALIMVGIITRLDSFVIIPVFGITHGLRPIVGYAYGSNNYNRIKNCLKIALLSATAFLTIMFILIVTLTPQIMGIFVNEVELIDYGIPILVLTHSGLSIIGFNIIGGMFFQSIKRNKMAFFFSLFSPLVLFVPLTILMANITGNIWAVWAVYPLVDVVTCIIIIIALTIVVRKLKVEIALRKEQELTSEE